MRKSLEFALKFARFGGTMELVGLVKTIIPKNAVYLCKSLGLRHMNTFFFLPAAINVFQMISELYFPLKSQRYISTFGRV